MFSTYRCFSPKILLRAGAKVDVLSSYGYTPLARAIYFNNRDCAELLLDAGATMENVHQDVEIPEWMDALLRKREAVKRGLLTFLGVMRKRFEVPHGGMEHMGDRLPRDMVSMLSAYVWNTRLDSRWMLEGDDEQNKRIKCGHKCNDKQGCGHKCCKK